MDMNNMNMNDMRMNDMNMHQHHDMTPPNSSALGFCKPMMSGGMTMYMNGFSFSLLNTHSNNNNPKPCLDFYFEGLTLDTRFKFFLAMVAVSSLGIAVEGVAWMKKRYISGVKKKRLIGNEAEFKRATIIFHMFQGVQALIGYILMLSAMTYSIELTMSAVVGLGLGSYIFGKHKILLSKSVDSMNNMVNVEDEGENPCCNNDFEDDGVSYGSMATNLEYMSITKDGSDDDDFIENSSVLVSRKRNQETHL